MVKQEKSVPPSGNLQRGNKHQKQTRQKSSCIFNKIKQVQNVPRKRLLFPDCSTISNSDYGTKKSLDNIKNTDVPPCSPFLYKNSSKKNNNIGNRGNRGNVCICIDKDFRSFETKGGTNGTHCFLHPDKRALVTREGVGLCYDCFTSEGVQRKKISPSQPPAEAVVCPVCGERWAVKKKCVNFSGREFDMHCEWCGQCSQPKRLIKTLKQANNELAKSLKKSEEQAAEWFERYEKRKLELKRKI